MSDEPIKPVRLQLSRRKGFKLESPNGLPVVIVDRRGKWGNPWKVRKGPLQRLTDDASPEEAVEAFVMMLNDGATPPFTPEEIRKELRGKNLACWCKLPEVGEPDICHAAVLLKIANEP